ncbi:MAG: CHRD domain-containing protein [Chthoniobacteraceae bacterium]
MKTLLTSIVSLALALQASAALIPFNLQGQAGSGLLSGNETGAVAGTPGSGGEIGAGITFDDVSKVLTINVGWGTSNGFTNLTGAISGAHIHGPAITPTPFTTTAGVVVNLQTNAVTTGYTSASFTTTTSASAGTSSGSVTLDATREAQLMASQLYINIHTATNGGGEIRGNLVAVPEPSSVGLAALGLMGIASGSRMRRRKAKAA